ncbi:MAG: hypothetical protein BroJett040_25480 [Oligoflexia bacterium]|nr:MAG: hypothetical protein BroJett040_25480 [Oligoflexia bacterium]
MLKNERGMATLEMIPILTVFIILVNFTFGFFGVIHSGILNSIGARNYAFETFRNRSNLNYLRDKADSDKVIYGPTGARYHAIISDSRKSNGTLKFAATQRPIKFSEVNEGTAEALGQKQDHTNDVRQIKDIGKASDIFVGRMKTDGKAGVNPVWIQTSYGICLNAKCVSANN